MGAETRTATFPVSPEVMWSYFEQPQSWPEWDPDIVGISDTARPGIVEGTAWDIEMRTPKTGKLKFSQVVPGKAFIWRVIALGGAMQGVGRFSFEPADDGAHTHFSYAFEMKGLLGTPFWLLARSTVVKGVDGGMGNITKRFSSI